MAPRVRTRWRARRTAASYLEAVFRADSLALGRLAASGSARTGLCIHRMWPRGFWAYADGPARLVSGGRGTDGFRFLVLSDSTRGQAARAGSDESAFELTVASTRLDRVDHIFGDIRRGLVSDAFLRCAAPARRD